ncbi:MAG: hypothetical protein AB3N28_01160 [Kordiimonas sp.]
MKFLRIEIVTKTDRQQALSQINDVISANEGWISNHQLFSNMAAAISFEMPVEYVENFLLGLKEIGFNPKPQDEIPETGSGDIRGSISVTFLHDEPDLKRDVPAFG